jgi:hypothetical protein
LRKINARAFTMAIWHEYASHLHKLSPIKYIRVSDPNNKPRPRTHQNRGAVIVMTIQLILFGYCLQPKINQ